MISLSLIASSSYWITTHQSVLSLQLLEQVKTIRLPQSSLISFWLTLRMFSVNCSSIESLLLQNLQKCLGLIGWLLQGMGMLEYIRIGPSNSFIVFLYYSNSRSFSSFFYYNQDACLRLYNCYFDKDEPYFLSSYSLITCFNPIFSRVQLSNSFSSISSQSSSNSSSSFSSITSSSTSILALFIIFTSSLTSREELSISMALSETTLVVTSIGAIATP